MRHWRGSAMRAIMEIEVSPRALVVLGCVIMVGLMMLLGRAVTPWNDGEPLVLSPDYVATVRYLRSVQNWIEQLEQVDADIARAMDGKGNFYSQGRDTERAFDRALSIAREIDQTGGPPTLNVLQSLVRGTSIAYIETARAVMAYVSIPSEINRQNVDNLMAVARADLEKSRKLQEDLWETNH